MDSISCSLRLILGRFLRKSRATAASPERDSSMRPEQRVAASASVVSREDAAVHHLGHQQLVVVPEPGDELPLGEELAVLHRPEALEHLDDPEKLLPVRVAEGVEHLPLLRELPIHPVEALPGLLAAALRAPRAAVALDRGERALRALALLALDQLGHRQARRSAR